MKKLSAKLQNLVFADSISGYEWDGKIVEVIEKMIGKKGERINDNLIYRYGKKGKKILITAHMDEIGFFLTGQYKNDRYLMPIGDVANVDVIGNVICFTYNNMTIDSGRVKEINGSLLASKLTKLPQGTVGTFKKSFLQYNDIVYSQGLDNKVGCLALVESIIAFSDRKINNQLIFCFSPREEIGTNGAMSAAAYFKPDLCIDIDSAYAELKGTNIASWIVPKIGSGPAIQLQGKNFIVKSGNRKIIEDICTKEQIMYQLEIPSSLDGGTNSSAYSAAGYNTMQINIPVARQHSAKSKASLKDVNMTIKLIISLLRQEADEIVVKSS